jgi:hypothetical protein
LFGSRFALLKIVINLLFAREKVGELFQVIELPETTLFYFA